MLSLLTGQWLGITLDYIIASLLVVAGLYLAFGLSAIADTNPLASILKPLLMPLRFVGYALIVFGLARGFVAYGKSVGASDCEARWKAANYEFRIANLTRDLNAARDLAAFARQQAADLAAQKEQSDQKVTDYDASLKNLSASLISCRHATGDDDKRLCDILGNAAAGCQPAR